MNRILLLTLLQGGPRVINNRCNATVFQWDSPRMASAASEERLYFDCLVSCLVLSSYCTKKKKLFKNNI